MFALYSLVWNYVRRGEKAALRSPALRQLTGPIIKHIRLRSEEPSQTDDITTSASRRPE
jgi:hypothetical protein